MSTSAPPSYEQVCNEQTGFSEVSRIKSITKSINGTQSRLEKIQFRIRFSKIYSGAISVSKYGIAGVKHSGGAYGSNQIIPSAQQSQPTCSHTSGISKPCRGCFEGERCNQLG